eukprot:GDKJ01015184.1.p1 GENE.GDKJ01015184.1~~GDKJ01015184.1.p1  ORF type:complete len:1115 (+),score=222.08 GDKJ01015184.1:7-3351(+)
MQPPRESPSGELSSGSRDANEVTTSNDHLDVSDARPNQDSSSVIPQHLLDRHNDRIRNVQHSNRAMENAEFMSFKATRFWFRTILLLALGLTPLIIEIAETVPKLVLFARTDQLLEVTPYLMSKMYTDGNENVVVFTPDILFSNVVLRLENQKFNFKTSSLEKINSSSPAYPVLTPTQLVDINYGPTEALVLPYAKSSFSPGSKLENQCTAMSDAFDTATSSYYYFFRYPMTGQASEFGIGDTPMRVEREGMFFSGLGVLFWIAAIVKWCVVLWIIYVISWDDLYMFGPWWEVVVRHSIAMCMIIYFLGGILVVATTSKVSYCFDFTSPSEARQTVWFQIYVWIGAAAALFFHLIGLLPRFLKYFFTRDPLATRPSLNESTWMSKVAVFVGLLVVIATMSSLLHSSANHSTSALMALIQPLFLVVSVCINHGLKLNRRFTRVDLSVPRIRLFKEAERKKTADVQYDLIKSMCSTTHDPEFMQLIYEDIRIHDLREAKVSQQERSASESNSNEVEVVAPPPLSASPPVVLFVDSSELHRDTPQTLQDFLNTASQDKINSTLRLEKSNALNKTTIHFECVNEALFKPLTTLDVDKLHELDFPPPLLPILSKFDKLCLKLRAAFSASQSNSVEPSYSGTDFPNATTTTNIESAVVGVPQFGGISSHYNKSRDCDDHLQTTPVKEEVMSNVEVTFDAQLVTNSANKSSVNQSNDDEDDDDDLCQVCFDAPSEVILHPCHHSGMCFGCAAAVVSTALRQHVKVVNAHRSSTEAFVQGVSKLDDRAIVKCPLCRENVRAIMRIEKRRSLDTFNFRKLLVSLRAADVAEEIRDSDGETLVVFTKIALRVPKQLVELPPSGGNNERVEEGQQSVIRSYSPSRAASRQYANIVQSSVPQNNMPVEMMNAQGIREDVENQNVVSSLDDAEDRQQNSQLHRNVRFQNIQIQPNVLGRKDFAEGQGAVEEFSSPVASPFAGVNTPRSQLNEDRFPHSMMKSNASFSVEIVDNNNENETSSQKRQKKRENDSWSNSDESSFVSEGDLRDENKISFNHFSIQKSVLNPILSLNQDCSPQVEENTFFLSTDQASFNPPVEQCVLRRVDHDLDGICVQRTASVPGSISSR